MIRKLNLISVSVRAESTQIRELKEEEDYIRQSCS